MYVGFHTMLSGDNSVREKQNVLFSFHTIGYRSLI